MKNAAGSGLDPKASFPSASESPEHVRVLIIDDDEYVRSMIGRLLAKLGVTEVREAADGIAGVRLIDGDPRNFHLAIVDIDMPNSDGMEFLRLMAQRKYAGALMILSGKPAALLNSVQVMAEEYGVNLLGVAQKPPSMALLKNALNSCRATALPKRAAFASSYPPEEILSGLDKGEFEAFFQPKVEVATRQLRGCEALARWRHPRAGIVAPGAFIGVIEEAKRMDELTRMMLGQAATWCRRWRELGLTLTVSVNLSISSLSDNNMADRTADIVRAAGIEPQDVILEITETLAMTNVLACLESLCRLRLRGFGLSIDDFGTGFSSLQQLTRVPYTELKIDQGFVNGAVTSAERRAVLASSVDIAKKLGLTSVAEGVETQADWELLRELGCQLAQGYFIAKPLSGDEFTTWAVSKG
jgi:EAL domain-containing protein (putative c-di-GMP-specific phosphodiesterase class I)/ActR/RegA family two-component response regulator